MIKEKPEQCKSKSCNNPVLNGKYCEHCTQRRKERRNKILGGAGSATIIGVCTAIKTGVIKQAPKIGDKVIKIVLRK